VRSFPSYVGSLDEALKLADVIRQFWADRGHRVTVTVGYVSMTLPGERQVDKGHYVIRSDLFNGLPR
jgi:hypothetical protein